MPLYNKISGYVEINGEKLRVLWKVEESHGGDACWETLRFRTTGKLGDRLVDEEAYLRKHPKLVADLKAGKVIMV